MGMYSCLKVRMILKDKYVDVIRRLYEVWDEMYKKRKENGIFGVTQSVATIHFNPWRSVAEEFNINFIRKWVEGKVRPHMLPFGANCGFMLDENNEWEEGLFGNVWQFICEFKNYDCEIETFVVDILPKITKFTEHCEYIYEEDDEPTMLIKDGMKYEMFDKWKEWYSEGDDL